MKNYNLAWSINKVRLVQGEMDEKFDNVFKKSPFSFSGIDLDVDNEVFKDIKLDKIFIKIGTGSNGNIIGLELN